MYLWPCIQMDLLQIRKFVIKFLVTYFWPSLLFATDCHWKIIQDVVIKRGRSNLHPSLLFHSALHQDTVLYVNYTFNKSLLPNLFKPIIAKPFLLEKVLCREKTLLIFYNQFWVFRRDWRKHYQIKQNNSFLPQWNSEDMMSVIISIS